ncbi:MAG: polyhydroxyalkanoate synthesis repressor PhaR [Pikeienuella sp.]
MAAKQTVEGEPIIIKKYANRRLYNTAKSCYVTLDHLAEMVREGQDFVVRDAKSSEDITRSVLTQIIFEAEAKGTSMLPTNFLRHIISLYGDTLQGVVPGYLEASMAAFSRNQDEMREKATSVFGGPPGLQGFESIARRNMDMFTQAMGMFTPFGAPQTAPTEAPEEEPVEEKPQMRTEDLSSLKDQLAEMQSQLDKLARKP